MSATPVSEPARALATYEATAPFYDGLTAHHDYELWLGNLLPLLYAHGLKQGRLLDVACGTGKSFMPMLARNWEVVGVDASPGMLEVARAKVGDRAHLETADMRFLPELGRFELIWCLDDAINCLDSTQEVIAAFKGFARNLAPHGLCLFDLNTLLTYRGFFAGEETVELADGTVLHWLGQTDPKATSGVLASAVLEARDGSGRLVASTTHAQRHFEVRELERLMPAAGLEVVAIRGHAHDAILEPLDEARHTKAILVVRCRGGR